MAKSLLRKIEERLQRIEAGELKNEIIHSCKSGAACAMKRLSFCGFIECTSHASCPAAVPHFLTISKAFQ